MPNNRLWKKGLVLGVIVLFVCVGFSSTVAIKSFILNNNNVIISTNVETLEDLPNLKIVSISAETRRIGDEMIPFFITHMRIKNIGAGTVYDLVKIQIDIYRGIGSSSTYYTTLGPDTIKLNLAPGQSTVYEFSGTFRSLFYKFVGSINDDKNVNESKYSDNVAIQKFLRSFSNWRAWTKIGPIYYPYLTSLKLEKEPIANSPELKDGVYPYKYNNPPDPPEINGPTNGATGEKLTYCTSPKVDSDNDSMFIFWDWGDGETDGWIGPYDPGEIICESHIWEDYGTYVIRAKLMDDSGAESDWGELTVTITKDKAVTINSLLLKQLETHPILQKIIQRSGL
jgi:hypothetical protein